jgi:hypothetical protein
MDRCHRRLTARLDRGRRDGAVQSVLYAIQTTPSSNSHRTVCWAFALNTVPRTGGGPWPAMRAISRTRTTSRQPSAHRRMPSAAGLAPPPGCSGVHAPALDLRPRLRCKR